MAEISAKQPFTAVVLIVVITLMHIALAAALPKWSTAIQREKEEEAIFRGLQYAEAIRVFKARFGRYNLLQLLSAQIHAPLLLGTEQVGS